ncbi:MAG: hypothetical protein IPJ65_37440 [Archangiaceae bacterium]|nr:hypothetical protein [Archangiaceae bacterium]
MTKAELFLKQCARASCQRAFLHCRSREPGRRYCPACSPIARRERERRARRKYRASPCGQEQHRDEEEERRERLRGVGDRRCEGERGQVLTRATTASYVAKAEEKRNARYELEWVLVAWPGLKATGEQMLGASVACPCCGREGEVVEALELDTWRRRRRRETS